jgi:hypothetical protein
MSDEQKPGGNAEGSGAPEGQAEDRLKNLQAEFSRKLSNIEEQNKRANEALLAQIASLAPKAAPESKPALDKVWYDNPAEAARIIKEETRAEIRRELDSEREVQSEFAQTTNKLYSDFPELSDESSDLAKLAAEKFAALPQKQKSSAVAMKAAVVEAAAELGVRPKSKRKSGDDSFSMGTSRGNTAAPPKKDDLDPQTERLARMLGVNVDDKEVRKRMSNNHGRKSYRQFE